MLSFAAEFPHVEVKQAKKEAKKEPAKSKAEDVEEEEEAPKPKGINSVKRLYSNTKTNFREVAIKGFCDMYVSFVTMNKVGGFLQRMDLARKYAFGKTLVIGSEPPFKVKGLWLFRWQEIHQFVMEECYDMELYDSSDDRGSGTLRGRGSFGCQVLQVKI